MSFVLKKAAVIILALLGYIYGHECPAVPQDGAQEGIEQTEGGEAQDEQEDAIAMTKTVRLCINEGKAIYGVLFTPESETDETYPLVIYSHGLGGVSEKATSLAKNIVSLGAAVYAFDFCGGSPLSRSHGSQEAMSLETEVSDLEAVIEQAQTWKEVDGGKIALIGHSQGGAVSAITAARQKEKIGGLILMAPAFVLPDYVHSHYESLEDIPPQAEVMGMSVGRTYFESIWDCDIYAQIGGLEKKVLIIHGSEDSVVAPQYSQRALEAYDDAELMLIEGGRHGVYWDAQERIDEKVGQYLRQIGFVE